MELRYDVYCAQDPDSTADLEATCDATGSVFVRGGDAGAFEELPLRFDRSAAEGRFVALVPPKVAQSRIGFTYYATFRNSASGEQISLPSGGAAAPQRSLPLARSVDVQLGTHVFGRTQAANARVAAAAWGDGPAEVGLEQPRNLTPIGGSSFDVDSSGTVAVLDEANRRLLRWRKGTRQPFRTPLTIDGTLADLAIADDGTIYVLESTGPSPRSTLVRTFDSSGSPLGSGPTAERATQVRLAEDGQPVVLQEPSEQWMQAARDGQVVSQAAQRRSGRAGRPTPDGGEVLVLRRGNEIRAAVVGSNGARRSWRVTSDTPLAEVQLAEPHGSSLVLVVRVYTSDHDEFQALVLGPQGLVRSLSIDSADWAETAPLSRFRLVGSSLYELGSTPAGLFVDRFDLEVK
jgi:hypothetical protein